MGDVSKGLVSVAEMVDSGHRVIFDSAASGGSYAEHKETGRRTPFIRRSKVFEIDVAVVPFSESPGIGQAQP